MIRSEVESGARQWRIKKCQGEDPSLGWASRFIKYVQHYSVPHNRSSDPRCHRLSAKDLNMICAWLMKTGQ